MPSSLAKISAVRGSRVLPHAGGLAICVTFPNFLSSKSRRADRCGVRRRFAFWGNNRDTTPLRSVTLRSEVVGLGANIYGALFATVAESPLPYRARDALAICR